MNVLLIALDDRKYLENAGDRIPIGLLYVGGELLKHKHKITIADLNHDDINNYMLSDYEYIGISFTTSQYYQAIVLCDWLQGQTSSKIIAGGVHPTIDPNSCKMFDYIVVGEGERAIVDIVENFPSGKVVYGKPAENLDDLSIAWNLINLKRYNMKMDGKRTATMLTSRGCPGHCIFCSRLFGTEFRFHSADYIMNQVKILIEKYHYKAVYFYDDAFTADKQRVLELAELFKSNFSDISLRITSRADLLDEDIIKALSEMGTKIISLGIEHIDNKVLKLIGKNMKIEDNLKAIKLAHKYNIKIKGFFILNLPGATKTTVRRTIKWAQQHCDYYDFYPLIAFPGTPIWNHPEKLGLEIIERDYGFWEAGKRQTFNIENPDVPNDYLKEVLNDI